MTEKQKLFADEYLIDMNATRAYKAVYKSVKNDMTAGAAGCRLLKNVSVDKYIKERLEEIKNNKIASAEEVLEYLTAVVRGESRAHVVTVEGVGEGCSAARVVEKPPDEKERLKAAELLGKRYALFTDKVDMDADCELNIVVDYGDGDDG